MYSQHILLVFFYNNVFNCCKNISFPQSYVLSNSVVTVCWLGV